MNNDTEKEKQLKETENNFNDRINDASGFDFVDVTSEEERKKKIDEILKKAEETYQKISKTK